MRNAYRPALAKNTSYFTVLAVVYKVEIGLHLVSARWNDDRIRHAGCTGIFIYLELTLIEEIGCHRSVSWRGRSLGHKGCTLHGFRINIFLINEVVRGIRFTCG